MKYSHNEIYYEAVRVNSLLIPSFTRKNLKIYFNNAIIREYNHYDSIYPKFKNRLN